MTDIFDSDSYSRSRISTDIDTNFFVEAGAGSGKTTQLVKRMTSMVKAGIDVSKICAITFTKAAAREFYKRFQESLAKCSTSAESETVRERCAKALRNIDLCFMGTIDAFSHLILSEHPTEAGIPADSSVKSESEMKNAYLREYSNILNGLYGGELLEKSKIFSFFHKNPQSVFTEFFPQIIEAGASRIIYDMPENTDIDSHLAEEKQELLRTLDKLMEHEEKWGDSSQDAVKAGRLLSEKLDSLKKSWNSQLADVISVLGKLDDFRLKCNPEEIGIYDTSLFAPYISGNEIKYYNLNIKESILYKYLIETQYSVTMDFLVSAASAVSDRLRKNGELTYFYYKLYLRDMLKNDAANGSRLIRHIYSRHSYFLIDEFQDTDPMQTEIFFYLTAENPVPDWRKCVPKKGSLFIVGDPKQSIYRFRSADSASFIAVRRMFENGIGEVLALTRNFRSTVQLKEWFNKAFSQLLSGDSHQQSKFSSIPIDGKSDTDSFGGVYSYPVCINGQTIVDDSEKVAEIISKLVHNPKYLIKDSDSKAPRMIEYSDFMVIVKQKEHIVKFMDDFSQSGIPVKVEGKTAFSKCPALTAVTAVMESISAPNDAKAVYGALTSGIFNISDEEIIMLRNEGLALNLYTKKTDIPDKNSRVKTAFEQLYTLVNCAVKMTPAAVFGKVMDELKVIEKTGADNLEYLYYALELLRSAEVSAEVITTADSAVFLRNLINKSEKERCISLQRNENRVHIANLHKVKGLEAPIVILADPRYVNHAPDKRVEQTESGSECHIFHLKNGNATIAATKKFSDYEDKEKASLNEERKRLMYVAATRAKNVLIIADARNSKGEPANYNPWEYFITMTQDNILEKISAENPKVIKSDNTIKASELYDIAAKNTVFENTCSEKSTYSVSLPSKSKIKSVASPDSTSDRKDETHVRRTDAALVGTMVHRLMEYIVSSKITVDSKYIVEKILNDYNADKNEYGKLLNDVYNRIHSGGYPQKNDMPDDIISELKNADEVYCELPFCYRIDNKDSEFTICHGIIDLLYKKGDEWLIVDYKTNAESDELDSKYSEQLEAYKSAFQAMTGETAKACIYHIDV